MNDAHPTQSDAAKTGPSNSQQNDHPNPPEPLYRVADVLQRDIDANQRRIVNLGPPGDFGEATYTDNTTKPAALGKEASPGKSLLAAAADHVHPLPAGGPSGLGMRIAASGKKVFVADGARVTLCTFKRKDGELFAPGGFAWVRDDSDEVTWEAKVEGAKNITTYHERTDKPDELRFRAHNGSKKGRTIDWATIALSPD